MKNKHDIEYPFSPPDQVLTPKQTEIVGLKVHLVLAEIELNKALSLVKSLSKKIYDLEED